MSLLNIRRLRETGRVATEELLLNLNRCRTFASSSLIRCSAALSCADTLSGVWLFASAAWLVHDIRLALHWPYCFRLRLRSAGPTPRSTIPQAKQVIFPVFILPSLATLGGRPPRGQRWVHEIKYDGYHFQCHTQRTVRFYTRRGNDWTERVTHFVNALQPLTDRVMILHGEVIVETRPRDGPISTLSKGN
jgi:ATP dependent DNA ligase domain